MSRAPFARAARVLLALAISVAGVLQPGAAKDALAVDCGLVYCATLEIVPTLGSGVGVVTSDPSGITCTWNGSRSGACLFEFSWPHFVGTTTTVDLYLDPSSSSYACWATTCGAVNETLVRTVQLNNGDNIDVFPGFEAAQHAALTIKPEMTGSGRATTSIGGINCVSTGGVASGTCSTDLYWKSGSSIGFTLTLDPDDGNYACNELNCAAINQTRVSNVSISTGSTTLHVQFIPATPVTVSISGSGKVVSDPAGISCPSTCSKWFPPDTPPDDFTSLIATPASGWYLKHWGGACDGTSGTTCTFFNGLNGASITVQFARLATPRPTVKPTAVPTAPHPSPGSSQAPASEGPAASTDPGASGRPTDGPAASDPAASSAASEPPASTAGPGGSPVPSPAPGPGADSGSGSPSSTVLVVVLAGLLMALVLGFGLTVRRRRSPGR